MCKYYILFSLLFLTLFSCTKENSSEKVESYSLKKTKTISELSDSSLFSDIRCISFFESKLYFTDYYRGQLITLKDDLTLYSFTGNKGSGPGEYESPSFFDIKNDTSYILDDMNRKIVIYNKNIYLGEIRSQGLYFRFLNFVVDNDYLYFSSGNNGSVTCLNLTNKEETHFGELNSFDTPVQNKLRNLNFVAIKDSILYTVSENLPIISAYNLQNKSLVYKYNYTHIPLIKKTIKYTDTSIKESNAYFKLIQDIYLNNDYLYLLCNKSTKEGDFSCNTLIEINIHNTNDWVVNRTYNLPGDVYSSFCINDSGNKIYAFNKTSSEIEIIDLIKR